MKTITTFVSVLILCSCSTFNPASQVAQLAATPAGSAVVANTSDKVIQKGLDAVATKIDTGNPYLHSVADAIRSNPDGLINPEDVQKIFVNYGDPNNKAKFKTLAWDLWTTIKNAVVQFGRENAAELIAKGLQDGAENKQPNSP